MKSPVLIFLPGLLLIVMALSMCKTDQTAHSDPMVGLLAKGLKPELISAQTFFEGMEPPGFLELTGAEYKPSFNEDPAIPPQCWIETSYGTQNACKYCHTDYLTNSSHGNAYPIGEDQILYSFPTANLNRVLWRNIILPQEIDFRLRTEGVPLPELEDTDYVRFDNWSPAFARARENGNTQWMNQERPDDAYALFPALNPAHLYPYNSEDPTGGKTHGYIDPKGFVRDENNQYTGWRAVNFFPYAIFTPLTGSVSGIYIRLPEKFMTHKGKFSVEVYSENLDLLERNIKNLPLDPRYYSGDASRIEVKKGFYPVGTEFAHPLHYVDLNADADMGIDTDGAVATGKKDYEFPGTRSKRVKEIRYMYKWKDVDLADIAIPDEEEEEEEWEVIVGREGQGWVENEAGWILAAYIEDRHGNLRPQTTEELAQCMGCHGKVGNTVDAVWSFQRKLPFEKGWGEMNYGNYNSADPYITMLEDYLYENAGMGELGYFYYTVVGADLYGVMPAEIRNELISYALENNLSKSLNLTHNIREIFNDEILKNMGKNQRIERLRERQAVMRHYSSSLAYLDHDPNMNKYFIKGSIFFPSLQTMQKNIQMYRRIVLDQSYNHGKDVFGTEAEHVPFTFRSDGTVLDENNFPIPTGMVIYSRPYGSDGVGYTPTLIVEVNEQGEPIDENGRVMDLATEEHKAVGHISTGGTFDMIFNPILSGKPVRK
jgi:hypothetical protein